MTELSLTAGLTVKTNQLCVGLEDGACREAAATALQRWQNGCTNAAKAASRSASSSTAATRYVWKPAAAMPCCAALDVKSPDVKKACYFTA